VFKRISIAARTVISGASGPAPALVARRLLALNRSEASAEDRLVLVLSDTAIHAVDRDSLFRSGEQQLK
jgi:hypothetical protein